MTIYQFFTMAAYNLRNHYLDLAYGRKETDPRRPDDGLEPSPELPTATNSDLLDPELQPSAEANSAGPDELLLSGEPGPAPADQSPEAPAQPDDGTDLIRNPDGTYFYRQHTRFDYRLGLSFDLNAVSRTLKQLSEGETETLAQLVAGSFGLTADFDFTGKQVTHTNMPKTENEAQPVTHMQSKALARSRQLQQIAVQNRSFAVQAFHRQATEVMNRLHVTERDGFRHTVNKFAYRFTLDSRLSFAFLQRFNIQTADMAEQMPESVGDYINSAGAVAEKAPKEMIAAFFDAVDAYLDGAEETIIEKVNQFFDMAAEQLGATGELVEQARDQVLETVENFFSRVDEALDQLESYFVPPAPEAPQPQQEDLPLPDEFENPAVTTEKTLEAAV